MPQSDGEVVWAKAPGFRHKRTVNAQQPRKGKKGKGKRKATDGACSMPQSDGEVVWVKARKGQKGKGKRKATDGACSVPQSDSEVVWAKVPGFRHREDCQCAAAMQGEEGEGEEEGH